MARRSGVSTIQKISSAPRRPRIPPTVDGIQVNFCKNPACRNYGVIPLSAEHIHHGLIPKGSHADTYVIATGGGIPVPRLHCRLCEEEPPIKSNLAIAEERDRLLATLACRPSPTCPNAACGNHSIPLHRRDGHYQAFGRTRSGSQRYRCLACGQTFSVGGATTRHKQPHKNRMIFSLLMNKSPFRRVCEVADLQPQTLYAKINFLFAQCQAFSAEREQRLVDGLQINRLYLGVDRQDYVVNWTQRNDRRNVILHAVGASDNETGYVFGMHLNYDPLLDSDTVERDARACGDLQETPPFRRHARCWLGVDYKAALRRHAAKRRARTPGLTDDIEATYDEAVRRHDVEVFETQHPERRLPTRGVQIHAEYTLYGHFFYLRQLLPGVEKLRFFLDQDSGMRAACLAAFQPDIAARRIDAFYVRIAKDFTVAQRKAAVAASHAAFEQACQSHPGLSGSKVKLLLIKQRIAQMAPLGAWRDKWLTHPFPHMSEPEKAVCYLTDYGDYDEDHLAWLYHKASLHAINRFFMLVRRRLSILERPIATASAARRTWYGYSAYNPGTIVKLLGIFRVFYNYCLVGEDGGTPAMRLGLAKGKVSLEDIIYF